MAPARPTKRNRRPEALVVLGLGALGLGACVDRAPPAAWPEPPPPTLAEPIQADGTSKKEADPKDSTAEEPGANPEDGAVRLPGNDEPK